MPMCWSRIWILLSKALLKLSTQIFHFQQNLLWEAFLYFLFFLCWIFAWKGVLFLRNLFFTWSHNISTEKLQWCHRGKSKEEILFKNCWCLQGCSNNEGQQVSQWLVQNGAAYVLVAFKIKYSLEIGSDPPLPI